MLAPSWVKSIANPSSCMLLPGLAVGGEHEDDGTP
jgi:hypothetical protein